MDSNFLNDCIYKVFKADSPTGYSDKVNVVMTKILSDLGYDYKISNKGNIEVFIKGLSSEKTVATSAHLDTLGLMVRSINNDGSLNIISTAGPFPTLDGEYCRIFTRDNVEYSGTILSKTPSMHVYKEAMTPATFDNLCIRIDEVVRSKEDVLKLGIGVGNFIFIEPKTTITPSGFLKSRFVDDKACVCAILAVLKELKDKNVTPKYDTFVYFTQHEEIGHGGSVISSKISEFVALDMGCVGLDLAGNEYSVSICSKDSGGAYNYELTNRLINLAKEDNLDYVVDVYLMYGSDIGAALKSGNDIKGALIGPGVHASHALERTHMDGLMNTIKLLYAYLTK